MQTNFQQMPYRFPKLSLDLEFIRNRAASPCFSLRRLSGLRRTLSPRSFRRINRSRRYYSQCQKEKCVRRRAKRKIEKAVQQNTKTARQCADRRAAPKLI